MFGELAQLERQNKFPKVEASYQCRGSDLYLPQMHCNPALRVLDLKYNQGGGNVE